MALRLGRQGTDSARLRITWDFWRSYEKQASTMTVSKTTAVCPLTTLGARNQESISSSEDFKENPSLLLSWLLEDPFYP